MFNSAKIKQILERILRVSQKNNGSIPIANIGDASNLLAYIEGYPSWFEYVESKTNYIKNKYSYVETEKKDTILKIKSTLGDNVNKIDKYISRLQIGSSYSKITKSSNLYFLNMSNTLILGEYENISFEIESRLKKEKQSFVILSDSDGIKLNPIHEIFNTELIYEILNVDPLKYKYEFVWLEIFKYSKIRCNYENILEMTSLEFLVEQYNKINEKNHLKSLIESYFISIDLEPNLEINESSRKEHRRNSKKFRDFISDILTGYDNGIFSEKDDINIVDFIGKIYIPSVSMFKNIKLIEDIINSKIKQYNYLVDGLNLESSGFWILNLTENLDLNNNKNTINLVFRKNINDASSKEFEQIIFVRQKIKKLLPSQMMLDFYLKTPNISDNIFALDNFNLETLNENEAYLWQKRDNVFSINKIDF